MRSHLLLPVSASCIAALLVAGPLAQAPGPGSPAPAPPGAPAAGAGPDLFITASLDKTKAFVDAYRAAYGDAPEFYAANYYEHVEFILRPLMKKIVDRGGDPAKPGELLAEMERALAAKFKFGSVYGGDMQLYPDGTVSKPLGVYEVKGDQLLLIGRIVEGKIETR